MIFILRAAFPNVAIVVMATAANQGQTETQSEAQAAWNAGIKVIGIGTTSGVSITEIRGISSSPQQVNVNYFTVNDPSDLSTIAGAVITSALTGTYLKATS